jgi:hypothetical protein
MTSSACFHPSLRIRRLRPRLLVASASGSATHSTQLLPERLELGVIVLRVAIIDKLRVALVNRQNPSSMLDSVIRSRRLLSRC